MHVILGVFVAFPAFVFFVTALALRLDPIRSAACRALLGMVALACFALQIISPAQHAATGPYGEPCRAAGAPANAFDDFPPPVPCR